MYADVESESLEDAVGAEKGRQLPVDPGSPAWIVVLHDEQVASPRGAHPQTEVVWGRSLPVQEVKRSSRGHTGWGERSWEGRRVFGEQECTRVPGPFTQTAP